MRWLLAAAFLTACSNEPANNEADTGPDDDVMVDCSTRGEPSCEDDGRCVLQHAGQLDGSRNCFGPRRVVGCRPAGMMCEPGVTYATDARGACWQVQTTCDIPITWTAATCGDAPACP